MKTKILTVLITVSLILSCLCGCASVGHNANTVRIAIQPSAAFIPLYIAREKGWIDDALAGYGVKVEWKYFESGPPMNDALLAGDADIGVIGDVPTVTVCMPGNNIEVIAIAARAADSYAVLVPSNSTLTNAIDLQGRRVATVFGSTGHNLVQKYLATAGLTIDDIDLVNIAAGDASAVLSSGQAEAVAIWEPNVSRITSTWLAKIIGEGSDCGLAGTNAIVARTKFAKKNPEIITEVLHQYKRAADAIPDLDDATLSAVASSLSIDSSLLPGIIPKFSYTVEIGQEDLLSLNDTIRFLNENHIIRGEYDISQCADGSYYKN